jgi:LAO/AO transport system kinase
MKGRWDRERLVSEFRAGNRLALARAVTMVENRQHGFEAVLHDIYGSTGRSWRIGVTGPPGAGKSTTVEELALAFRAEGKRIGILAVDPTSPFSGGALLGDRVRMAELSLDPGVFIRSLASRGALGGLTETTDEILHVLEALGFDILIIETVGVGQSELDIASEADSTVVILVPESGDSIQILKAGLLEIADILVINKSDRPGADALFADIGDILEMRGDPGDRAERIVQTVAARGKGIDELKAVLEEHRRGLEARGELESVRRERAEGHLRRIVRRRVLESLDAELERSAAFEPLIDRIVRREITPYRAAGEILKAIGR